VWTPEAALPTVEREQLKWLPAEAGDPFVLRVPELFRPL
jgi:hypothetical protein